MAMTAAEVLKTLDRLDAAEVGWWIDGGWGVDALLGEQTRSHDDLDLVVEPSAVARVAALLPEFAPAEQEWRPPRFFRDDAGLQLDFHPVDFDDAGNGWKELPDGTRSRYPAEGLTGRGVIADRPVRCITAELQLVHLVEYATSHPDDVDWHDVHKLCERFRLDPPIGLRPTPGL
jgi:lincosamide nucleotidyltransferase A/C/D/E